MQRSKMTDLCYCKKNIRLVEYITGTLLEGLARVSRLYLKAHKLLVPLGFFQQYRKSP